MQFVVLNGLWLHFMEVNCIQQCNWNGRFIMYIYRSGIYIGLNRNQWYWMVYKNIACNSFVVKAICCIGCIAVL